MLPSPTNFLKQKDSICAYANLEIASINAYASYKWSTGASGRKIMVQQPGDYWLKVTDANGCSGSDSITILPKQCMFGVYIPTAFTPNGDGKNDFFKALVFGKVLSFKLQVFDRGGQIVFQTTDPNKQWDGRNKGAEYSTGVFVWQCSYELEGQKPGFQKGTVTIVR
jgi:gliding motility-associated-like protein